MVVVAKESIAVLTEENTNYYEWESLYRWTAAW